MALMVGNTAIYCIDVFIYLSRQTTYHVQYHRCIILQILFIVIVRLREMYLEKYIMNIFRVINNNALFIVR